MYSNERKNGFSILELLVKIIFAAIFIFILVWLFQKKIPNVNMTPFYSNVFRENIKYMQEAGEGYFTTDKLPTTVGESIKLTLEEMESMNIILPFVDKDGEACDKKESYVSITKLEGDLGYELKTNLVCGKESNFVTKTLGCHVYCPNNGVKCDCNCNGEKQCSFKQITQYQFKKQVKGTTTKYSCDKGYTLKGKICYKSVLKDTKSAIVTKTKDKTVTVDAKLITEKAKLQQLNTVVTKTLLKTQINTTPSTTKKESYACTKTRVVKKCETKYRQEGYACQCSTKFVGGVLKTACNTCYETVSYQSCNDVNENYTDTCYREVTVPGTTTYSCPTGTDVKEGSGANLKCYKKTYSCPTGTDVKEGSGANLKCYKVISGSSYYKCTDSSYKLSGSKCSKVVKETYTVKECPSNYKLEGNKCNLYETKEVKAKASRDWRMMSEEDRQVYNEKKKDNDDWFEKAKNTRKVTALSIFVQNTIQSAKDKKKDIPKLGEIAPLWKKLAPNEKAKYKKYADTINEERERLQDIYELVNGVKPKKPAGAFRVFLQEKAKEKALHSIQEGKELWDKLSDEEKEVYLKKAHTCKLAYKYKNMIYKKKIKKIMPKRPANAYAQFLKDKKGQKIPKGEKAVVYWRDEYENLTKDKKKKYIEKAEKEKERYEKKMEEFKNYIFDLPKRPLNAFTLFVKDRVPDLKTENPKAAVTQLIKIAAKEWKKEDGVSQSKYEKKAEQDKKRFSRQMKEFEKLGYYKLNSRGERTKKADEEEDDEEEEEVKSKRKMKKKRSTSTASKSTKKGSKRTKSKSKTQESKRKRSSSKAKKKPSKSQKKK